MASPSDASLAIPRGGRPNLDRQHGPFSKYGFLAVLVAGLFYTGFSVFRDVADSGSSPSTLLPYLLLGFALLIALGFEFVNGFHDTANAVATVIYTHSLPPHMAVRLVGSMQFHRRAGIQRRRCVRHHFAAAGRTDPAGGIQRRFFHGLCFADCGHSVESRYLVAWASGIVIAYDDRLDHRGRHR